MVVNKDPALYHCGGVGVLIDLHIHSLDELSCLTSRFRNTNIVLGLYSVGFGSFCNKCFRIMLSDSRQLNSNFLGFIESLYKTNNRKSVLLQIKMT